jgi:hypothetical protein
LAQEEPQGREAALSHLHAAARDQILYLVLLHLLAAAVVVAQLIHIVLQ